jgi:hypothetical protein
MKRRNTPEPARHPVTRERTDVVVRLLFLLAFFSLAFFGINARWPWLRHIDVRGAGYYSSDQIIALAGLDDCDGLWAIALPRERISQSLEHEPYIELADISLTGLNSIRIKITERHPVAAIAQNGYRFIFDRSGELLEIVDPDNPCYVPEVGNVPPGLLKHNGIPFYRLESAWSLPENTPHPEIMERQFDRLIQLRYFLDRYALDKEENLESLSMDSDGNLSVEYRDCPPVLLGKFDSPDVQVRRLIATINDGSLMDIERIEVVDLSSVLFPCYQVRGNYLTRAELRFMDMFSQNVPIPVTIFDNPEGSDESAATDAESADGDNRDDSGDDNTAVIGTRIFDLAGGG